MLEDGTLGRYKIITKIGSGGMGDVYLAEDSKLERKVALKTLPTDVASDSERMSRFIHEAKTASALNHPNIITIYEINDDEETPFIAMEYVPGNTITKLMKGGRPVDLELALDIATQVAGALWAAHEAKVVHRDIKPDNIIVRPDGVVKVLDFGLAKLTENDGLSDPEAETIAHRTNPGMILGTASFMSPEQARGKDVDGRSDIFSFGTVLFHMFAGHLPFSGENYIDVIASILHKEPPPLSDYSDDVPHSIDALVRKCLRKNRDERFQSAKELQADLRDIRQDLNVEMRSGQRRSFVSTQVASMPTNDELEKPFSTTSLSPQNTSSIRQALVNEAKLHPLRLFAGTILVLTVIMGMGVGINRFTRSEVTEAAFQSMRISKATSTGDIVAEQVAISGDGKLLVYVAEQDGKESIWVKQSEAQSSVQTVPPTKTHFRDLSLSPDSNHIYFIEYEPGISTTLYQMPVLGGPKRKLMTNISGPVAFSPDMAQIAFVRGDINLMIGNIDGSEVRQIATGQNGDRFMSATWSPEKDRLIAAVYSPSDNTCRLIEISTTDNTQKVLPGDSWMRISGLAWLPGSNGVVISGRDKETQLSQIWFISYPDGKATRITNDPGNYLGVSASSDGQAISSVQMNRQTNIWTGNSGEDQLTSRLTTGVGRDEGMAGISWTPDGRIVHSVRITGNQDLWITDNNSGTQLTFNSRSNFAPTVSPDGQHIAFVSTREGRADIWRMNINGEKQIRLTSQEGINGEPKFTPDGNWIIYSNIALDTKSSIWKIAANGGEPSLLISSDCYRPEISPDGAFISCLLDDGSNENSSRIAIFSINGGQPLKVLDFPDVIQSRSYKWSDDGRSFLYIDNQDRIDNIWKQPLDGGKPSQVTSFNSEKIYRFDLSRKNLGYAFSRGSETSDVVVITNIR